MDLITTTSVYHMNVPMIDIIDSLVNVGFKKLDLAFDYCLKNEFASVKWERWAKEIYEHSKEKGVEFLQAHGIGDICKMQYSEEERDLSFRVLKVSSLLGIKFVVMHPYDVDWGRNESMESYVENNIKLLTPFLRQCEQDGIYLAIENLPWGNSARAEALVQVVEGLNSKYVGICWDTGHAHLLGLDVTEVEKTKGHLLTMHAHENFLNLKDDHLIPYDGTLDWKQFLLSLRKIDYAGDFSLEAHHQTLEAENEEEVQKLLRQMHSVGKDLCKEWDSLTKEYMPANT